MAKRRGKGEGNIVIIRREEIVAGGHHGGAWKVAYADFVTAMMAFFLLMWLLNATTEQQRRGIAAYFSPLASVENGFSGAGLVPGGISPLDGGTSLTMKGTGSPPVPAIPPAPGSPSLMPANANAGDGDADNAILSDDDDQARDHPPPMPVSSQDVKSAPAHLSPAARAAAGAAEQRALGAAAATLRQLVAADPTLGVASGQMAIDVTPDGLRIQIMDREGQPMFDRGEARLNARAVALLRKVAPFLAGLSEPVSIGGYTDAAPWPDHTTSNWSLSAGRADAARAVLTGSGLADTRITDVTGYADRHLLLPAEPLASANRRVVLTLHRLFAAPTTGPNTMSGG